MKTGIKMRADAGGGGGSRGAAQASDRSEGPHNIFRPDSALSQSDEDLDDIEESLSQSISKLQSLQSQLSGINKNNSADVLQPSASQETLNSHRSLDPTPRNLAAMSSPKGVLTGPSPRDMSARGKNVSTAYTNDLQVNGLANNMTSQKQKAKASLSSIENSYQNIKHKTPVNQVRRVPSTSSNPATQVSDSVMTGEIGLEVCVVCFVI